MALVEAVDGTWVLDNRARGIRRIDDPRFAGYRWIVREESGSTKSVSLAPRPLLAVLARRPLPAVSD